MDHPNLARGLDLVLINKNSSCRFCFARRQKSKSEGSQNIEKKKRLGLAGELKKVVEMKVTVIPMVVGIHGIIPPEPGKETGWNGEKGRIGTIQTTTLLKNQLAYLE